MFEFTALDGMSRPDMLLKQKQALSEWRTAKSLENLWDGFGNSARKLLDIYEPYKVQVEFLPELSRVFGKGRRRQEKITQYLEKLDAYMRDMDTRLSDGTKWYNALDIVELYNMVEGGTEDK